MHSFTRHITRTAIAALLVTTLGMTARAQVGPDLVIEPWTGGDEPYWAETWDEPLLIKGSDDKKSGEEVDIFYWDSLGRVKLDRNNPDPDLWFGYRILAIDIDTGIPEFPKGLMDVAVVAAARIAQSDDWTLTLTGGAGTANDMHFSNSDAIYGIGNLNATKQLDEKSRLHLGLNYNGNRTFLPDVPLPYAMYERTLNNQMMFFLGVPRSGVKWRPLEPLVVEAEFTLPYQFDATVSWYFNPTWSVFGEYKKTLDAFYLDGRDNTRIFYEFTRAAAGVRMQASWLDARIGAGYAFDQDFSTGFDVRDLDNIAEPDDALLLFLTIAGTF